MNIAYLSDQFIPASSADTEQFVNMVSALSNLTSVELVSAVYANDEPPTLQEIHDFYFTEGNFKLSFIDHLFPNIRGLEKVFFALRSAFKVAKNDQIELIYTRNIPIVIACLLLTRVPVLFETFRPWPDRNILSKWFFKKMAGHSKFAGIVLHSEFAKKSFLNVGFKEERLTVQHNAIQKNLFEGISGKEQALRRELDLPEDQFLVSYTGTVKAAKGLDHFLTLAEAFPEVLFIMVGSDGPGEIEQRASKMGNVKVIPRQDKKTVIKYISCSDILYIPTSLRAREKAKNTVLPLKTFIYKAGGKPVIAPDIEDMREVLKHEETALLIPPDNDEAAIKGLKRLLDDEDLRARLGSNAKAEMETMTWTQRAKNVLNFVDKRLSKGV